MCGIIGAVSTHSIVDSLLNGLKHLEYRGYDSSGLAVLDASRKLVCHRTMGKVDKLIEQINTHPLTSNIGIAHNRWATHGKPTEKNAHPQCANQIAVVHNGIIENHFTIKAQLIAKGVLFHSDTDTEILPWLLHQSLQAERNLLKAVQRAIQPLKGAFSTLFLVQSYPSLLIGIRQQSPLVIGLGKHGNFLASDKIALLPNIHSVIYLEEGDIALVSAGQIEIYNQGEKQNRLIESIGQSSYSLHKGNYTHYMQKEIQEQAQIVKKTWQPYTLQQIITLESLQIKLPFIRHIHITACGSSYHTALVGRFWIEQLAGIPCVVEVASEFRYRESPVLEDTLFVTLSQSGETADTLAALRMAKQHEKYRTTLAIVSTHDSSLARESDWVVTTQAGIEIGVAATKSFFSQLNTLLLLAMALAHRTAFNQVLYQSLVRALPSLPYLVQTTLLMEDSVVRVAEQLQKETQGLLIARGIHYPIALEGALKLKEIAYMHTEACPSGELKHGILALLTDTLPIIILAPDHAELPKLEVSIHETLARGGQLIIFAGKQLKHIAHPSVKLIRLPGQVPYHLTPLLYTIPLQYLAYHIARLKGLDIDQPRHLAKSVTVE